MDIKWGPNICVDSQEFFWIIIYPKKKDISQTYLFTVSESLVAFSESQNFSVYGTKCPCLPYSQLAYCLTSIQLFFFFFQNLRMYMPGLFVPGSVLWCNSIFHHFPFQVSQRGSARLTSGDCAGKSKQLSVSCSSSELKQAWQSFQCMFRVIILLENDSTSKKIEQQFERGLACVCRTEWSSFVSV